ncbi:F-box domain-containing protein [Mycena venus]|uniref:F-box domain-containing protein n=1 Tax=Mycena venus TaxID=2733690 RepID=A0A8H6Z056_9AGAR|nr:F-box domain-containing protein [Mycena venus]
MLTTASELRTRLQHIEAEISRLQLSLQSLHEARTGVLEELRSLEGSRSSVELPSPAKYPVLTLPFEITSQIFLECLPEDPIRPYPSLDAAPLIFTRVCRDWRTVALSTSTLWNHVRIELDSDDRPGHLDSKWVALLDLWLKRSQTQPLSLAISNWSYTEPHETLLGVLDGQSRRWRDITFRLPFNSFSRLEEHASLPLLERLTLSAHGSPDIINPISGFRHAPLLRHVCFEAGMHPSDIILPWDQLTSVEFYGARADDCLELLELTPNIVSCVLDVQYDSHAVALGSPLTSLRSFTVSGPACWGLLRYIAMPALQTLDLSRCPLAVPNFSQIVQFVKRSQCQLRDLKIYVRSSATAQQAVYLLHLLPSLTTLHLVLADGDTGTIIFGAFKAVDSGRIILPRVESISAHCMHDYDDNQQQIMLDVITDALQIRGGLRPAFEQRFGAAEVVCSVDRQQRQSGPERGSPAAVAGVGRQGHGAACGKPWRAIDLRNWSHFFFRDVCVCISILFRQDLDFVDRRSIFECRNWH